MNTQPASNSTPSAIARGSCQALARVMTIVSATAAATAMMTAAPRNARGRSRAVVRGLPETAWRGGCLASPPRSSSAVPAPPTASSPAHEATDRGPLHGEYARPLLPGDRGLPAL
jgi:hypothetical protein